MPNRRIAMACVAAAALALGGAGCGSSHSSNDSAPTAAPDGKTVVVDHMRFTPASLTVHVGDTVTWRFEDRFTHSVQGLGRNGLELNSPLYDKGGVWQHQFTAPGTYNYTCPLHSDMKATVIVQQ